MIPPSYGRPLRRGFSTRKVQLLEIEQYFASQMNFCGGVNSLFRVRIRPFDQMREVSVCSVSSDAFRMKVAEAEFLEPAGELSRAQCVRVHLASETIKYLPETAPTSLESQTRKFLSQAH